MMFSILLLRFNMFYVEQKNKNKEKLYNFIEEEFTVNTFVFILYFPEKLATMKLSFFPLLDS